MAIGRERGVSRWQKKSMRRGLWDYPEQYEVLKRKLENKSISTMAN